MMDRSIRMRRTHVPVGHHHHYRPNSNQKRQGRRAIIHRCHLRRQWARTLTSAKRKNVLGILNSGLGY